MKTLNELLALAKQDRLDEIDTLAALAQGWIEQPTIYGDYYDELNNKTIDDYHPTRDKAQAWDLMVKEQINPFMEIANMVFIKYLSRDRNPEYPKIDPRIAVTIAFILAKQREV